MEPCKGPVSLFFGAMVEHYPISARGQSWLHQFVQTVLPGKFLGHALIAAHRKFILEESMQKKY